jgi:D-3-phosphoglycerate dehydrogenase
VDIANQMCDVFDQKDFVGILNVPYIAQSTQVHMKPFMHLAEMVGSLIAQTSDSKIVRVELRTEGGKDIKIDTKTARQLLEAKVLQGILKKDHNLEPDMISAPGMARDAKIESTILDESISNCHEYLNLVSVHVTREDGSESTVVGCVFGATPHIVSIDTFEFTFKPQGNYVLTFKNEDKPGAVLEVLKVLHNDSVNLASINVARDRTPDANTALTCISMDNNLSAKAMKAIQQLPGMTSVAKIQLN